MFQKNIRNFSIIAHIDHGKSTLADRILEITGAINSRLMKNQFLDQMDLEQEKGITIKSQAVRLSYPNKKIFNENIYNFNLIDTPGHVDFQYEVNRALSACEGVLLIIDASQGVESQTITNANLAIQNNLKIIPVINKIDLSVINTKKIIEDLKNIPSIDVNDVIVASAKLGIGIKSILNKIIEKIPPPKGTIDDILNALIIDSWYDDYKGVILLIRIFNGSIKIGQKIKLINANKVFQIQDIGAFTPEKKILKCLNAGEVGFISANIKHIYNIRVGDTITLVNSNTKPIRGFKPHQSMVFSSCFPHDSDDYNNLKDALQKLSLNDASLHFENTSSQILGLGFRCGFLGLLHMEIIKERLEREFKINLILTSPTVKYKIYLKNEKYVYVDNPIKMPSSDKIHSYYEPYINAEICSPKIYIGSIIKLCNEKRGKEIEIKYLNGGDINLNYSLPLSEVISDFFDKLKKISKGYGNFSYTIMGYEKTKLVKIEILINHKAIDALSFISYDYKILNKCKEILKKIKTLIKREQYAIVLQAAIGNKIIARESITAYKKDVIAKCYGGDITRKRKLIEKQKKGKKKMSKIGKINLPSSLFLEILK